MPAKKIVAATEFKSQCLELIDEVFNLRSELVITKHGRPMARLVPIAEGSKSIFGRMKGSMTIVGDIVSSDTEPWHSEHDE